jgi:thiol:disulfide interchange protein DsbC
MKQTLRASVLAAAASIAVLAFATGPALAAADTTKAAPTVIGAAERARVIALLEQKTGMKATNVETSPLPNFYTLTVDLNVFYMERTGKWLFDGHLVDLDTKTSVTAQKKLELEKVGQPTLDWRTLNLADAIKTVRGEAVPGRVLVTFEDPNCAFCKKLHPELEKLQNLTVYTFPVAILGPDSQAKNEALWCTKSRVGSWAAVMASQPVKAEAACDTSALARNSELARKLMVRGTPTLFLADGSRIPGFMDAASIEAKLATQSK